MAILRVCASILKVLLLAGLITWFAAAPLVWILRDGLAPGMVESDGMRAVIKFAAGWGLPTLMLAAPLIGIRLIEHYLAKFDRPEQAYGE